MSTPLISGTVLNKKYRIDRVLGSGGFGITYLALDSLLQTQVCIKELFPSGSVRGADSSVQWTSDIQIPFQRIKEYFIDECRRVQSIGAHPSIVKTRDIFEENETAYLVMEFVQGLTIGGYVRQSNGSLPVDQAIRLTTELAEAVAVVHDHQLLHLDIKPENVIVGLDNRVVLIDFGSARDIKLDGQTTRTTIALVSQGYSALELYSGAESRDETTDIYSLGAVLFYMLTGKHPTDAPSRAANDPLVRQIQQLSVPVNLQKVLLKAMSVTKPNRYQTVRAFVDSLNRPASPDFLKQVQAAVAAIRLRLWSGWNKLTPANRILAASVSAFLVCVSILWLFWKDPKIPVLPVAHAGDDQQISVLKAADLELIGNGDDGDGKVSSYQWRQIEGPPVDLPDLKQSRIKLPKLDPADYLFTLVVTDEDGNASDPDSVRISILDKKGTVNNPPVAKGYSINYIPGSPVNIDLRASDPDGDRLSYLVLNKPKIGVMSGKGSTRYYQVGVGKSGVDVIEFRVSDGKANSNTAKIQIRISGSKTPAPSPPPIVKTMYVTTMEGDPKGIVLDGYSSSGKNLAFRIKMQPTRGSVQLKGSNQAVYSPQTGYTGQDQFTYTVSDGLSAPVENTVIITVSKKEAPASGKWIVPDIRAVQATQVFSMDDWQQALKDKRPAWCYFNFQSGDPNQYGPYFNQFAVKISSGVCPSGWHIPTLEEWDKLNTYDPGDQKRILSQVRAGFLGPDGFVDAGSLSCFWIMPTGFNHNNLYAEVKSDRVKDVRKVKSGFPVRCRQ